MSMKELDRIADQLQRAFYGEAWHGPSVQEVLAGVTAQQAATRVLPPAHTIWELVLHIAAWKSIVQQRLEGVPAREIKPEEDWPPVGETSEAGWTAALKHLEQAHQKLVAAASKLSEARLDEPAAPGVSPAYRLLHGVIQHDLYHAGQIALLKKA
jgi:uncharacterized damage-inducible protein DinB